MSSGTAYSVTQLIAKMKNVDHDFRFMALSDLTTEANKPNFGLDSATETALVNQVLALMSDTNTEVKNQAVKAIGALVKKLPEKKLLHILDKISTYSVSPKDDQLRDIANLGLRTVIREISVGSTSAQAAVDELVPKLLSQIEAASTATNTPANQDMLLNAIEILTDIFTRFDACVTSKEDLQKQSKKALIPLLTNSRPAIRKRTVDALAQLVALAPADNTTSCASLLSTVIQPTLSGKGKVDVLTAVSLVGALASRAPAKIGPMLIEKDIINRMISAAGVSSSNGDGDADMDADDASDDGAQVTAQAETREAVLQTLERLMLRCPKEMARYATAVLDLASSLISWDPNYAGGDDADDDVEMNGDDEDDDFGDDYSDDDDVSWKVRRAATRAICAVIETRPEILRAVCKNTVPLLISRFSEREESVRLEVWSTFASLLDVVGILDGVIPSSAFRAHAQSPLGVTQSRPLREGTPNVLKRKRGADDTPMSNTPTMIEESAIAILRGQAPAIAKALIKQISTKSIASAQAAFNLLDSLVLILQGGLDDQLSSLVSKIETALATSSASANMDSATGSATSLKLAALVLLTDIFATHPLTSFEPSLKSKLLPGLVTCTSDKYNKTSSAAFGAMSALIKNLRLSNTAAPAPVTADSKSIVQSVLEAVASRLEVAGADSEVRDSAVNTLGDVLAQAGDVLSKDLPRALGLLDEALRKEVTRISAVKTLSKIAFSPLLASHKEFQSWASQVVVQLAGFLRQSNRSLRVEAFTCLPLLIHIAGQSLSAETISTTTAALAPSVSTEDVVLLPNALLAVIALLKAQPQAVLQDAHTQSSIIPSAYNLTDAPGLQSGPPFEALLNLFGSLAASGADPNSLVDRLKRTSSRAGPKCIGAVVMQSPQLANSIADNFVATSSNPKSTASNVVFALMALGEIGRVPAYTGSVAAFKVALKLSTSSSEEIRNAAAYALGNLAVGAPQLVTEIVEEVASEQADDKKRSLFLHALKEFIAHAERQILAERAESLWTPLFAICAVDGPAPPEPAAAPDAKDDVKKARQKRVEQKWKEGEALRENWKQTETSRNVAAECLGKIALAEPQRYLNQLQARLQDSLAGIRAAIISAVRFALADSPSDFDEALAPVLVSYLSLMADPNLDVRRSALAAFNAAAQHRSHLIRSHLSTLLPMLYQQTIVNADLIRIVEMGPFKHKVDDGLEVRKAAYETCFTLLDTCLARLDTHELLDCVLRGITDDHEIRAICYLMLIRLSQVAPITVTQKLDSSTDSFASLFNEKLKDTAVKQEQEKLQQMQLSAMRAVVVLYRLASPAATPKFCNMVNALKTSSLRTQFEDMLQEPGRSSSNVDMDMT